MKNVTKLGLLSAIVAILFSACSSAKECAIL